MPVILYFYFVILFQYSYFILEIISIQNWDVILRVRKIIFPLSPNHAFSQLCMQNAVTGLKGHKSAASFSAGCILKCMTFCSYSRSLKNFNAIKCREKIRAFFYILVCNILLVSLRNVYNCFLYLNNNLFCCCSPDKIHNFKGKREKQAKYNKTQKLLRKTIMQYLVFLAARLYETEKRNMLYL